MSSLKYKPSNSSTSSSTGTGSSQLPIWCSLSTPSQIARKYASIAPIWCHISRPRQLKQKFKSTFHQAQSLLTRTHSKDSAANGVNGYNNNKNDDDDSDMHTAINTFKNANKPWSGGANIPASLSKSKISSYSSSSNNYDNNAELTSILKKRENSLEAKKKENVLPTHISSPYYTATTNLPQSASGTGSTRWISSSAASNSGNVKDKSAYESASTIVGSFYEENHLPALSSHATDANGGTRRPNKYISKYNSGGKAAGSKTEKIVTKSSKSSPNLLSKDYSDRYDQTSKWQQGNTNNNQYLHHNHHSSINSPYMNSYTFNQPHMTTSNSNPGAYSSYTTNASATNREDKWNELDTMLGAQSALLTRLESDFVANRSKAAKPVTANPATTTPSVTVPNYQISGKYQQQSSELPKPQTESTATPIVKKKPLKYATSKTEKIIISDEPAVAASHFQKFSNRKAEPIIELLNSLELNEPPKDKQVNSELVDNYNLEIDSKLKTASKHSMKEAAATNGCDNIDDFVDDFVNDYLNNTLKATEAEPKVVINKSLPTPTGMSSSLKNISSNNMATVNRHTSNTSLASTASATTTTTANNTSPTNNYNSMGSIVLNTPSVVNLVDNNNNNNNNHSTDNFKQNWYLFWLIILGL